MGWIGWFWAVYVRVFITFPQVNGSPYIKSQFWEQRVAGSNPVAPTNKTAGQTVCLAFFC